MNLRETKSLLMRMQALKATETDPRLIEMLEASILNMLRIQKLIQDRHLGRQSSP